VPAIWSAAVVIGLAAIAAVIVVTLISRTGNHESNRRSSPSLPLIAWLDGGGRLHIGDLSGTTQHVVGIVNGDPAAPLVANSGNVFLVDTTGEFVPEIGTWSEVVRVYNLAHRTLTYFGPGQGVFASADGRSLFLPQMDSSHLIEIPVSGAGMGTLLALPTGWFLPGGYGQSVGDDIVVLSTSSSVTAGPSSIGLWRPGSRTVRRLGVVETGPSPWVVGAFTAAGANHGVLAWIPFSCAGKPSCPIELTDTQARSTRSVRPPSGRAFVNGGAFSPDGRELAVFVTGAGRSGNTEAQLGILNVASGRTRIVPGVRFPLGIDLAWARWLNRTELVSEGASANFLVDAASLSAKPVAFFHPGSDEEVDYSTVVVTPA
jgi:hypothetical protein